MPSSSVAISQTLRSTAETVERPIPAGSDPIGQHRAEYRRPSVWLWRRAVGTAMAFVAVITVWVVVKLPDGLVSDQAFPTPGQTVAALARLRADGFAGATLGTHVAATLARLVLGVLIGAGIGGLLGLVSGSSPLARTVTDPVVSFLRAMPAIALGPLILIWVAPGDGAIVMLVAGPVLLTALGLVDDLRIRDLRATRADAVHAAFTGLRRVVGVGWAAALATETILATEGLGPLLWSSQQRPDLIVAGLLVVGVVGATIDTTIRSVGYLIEVGRPGRRSRPRRRSGESGRRSVSARRSESG